MDCMLAAYPRSGVTFLRHVLEAMYGYDTLSAYPEEHETTGTMFPGDRLYVSGRECSAPIRWVKSHEMYVDPPWAFHLVRDGRDTLCSHARFERLRFHGASVMTYVDVLDDLIRGVWVSTAIPDSVWNWGTHTKNWLTHKNVVRIRFEDLIADPVGVVRGAVARLPIELTEVGGKVETFDVLHARYPHFFRRGLVGSWREDMPEELQELFWEFQADAMGALGYAREEACVV